MKKTRLIYSLIALVAISVAIYALWPSTVASEQASVVNDLPALTVLQTNGESVSIHDLEGNVVLIFFNPDCDHCQREAKQISEQKSIFKSHSVYFISIDSITRIERFAIDFKLTDPNFHFAQADGFAVYNSVGPMPSVPAFFIYDHGRFVKKLAGEVKLEEVMKYL
jgi:peroxiredoxin